MNDYAWVCDRCLTASCWAGQFFCQENKLAGITVISRKQFAQLRLEHADYFDNPDVRASPIDYMNQVASRTAAIRQRNGLPGVGD